VFGSKTRNVKRSERYFSFKAKKVLSFVSLGSKNNFIDLWKQNKKFDAIRCKKKQKMDLFSCARKQGETDAILLHFAFAKIFLKQKQRTLVHI
jgi:hypothetical protein